jgi:gliding motility-associated-like protein
MIRVLKLAFVLSLIVLASSLKAQTSGWTVTPGDYNYSMTITGVVKLNYIELNDTNDVIGAFVNGQCRGLTNLVYQAAGNRYLAYLMVYSNTTNENVYFKVYKASSATIDSIPTSMVFKVNGITGTTEFPYVWSNPTMSNEAKMLSFSLDGQSLPTIIYDTIISLEMPFGTNFNAFIPQYTTSPNASVYVKGVLQTSGINSNAFSDSLVYKVLSADETTSEFYSIRYRIQTDTTLIVSEFADLYDISGTINAKSLTSNLAFSIPSAHAYFDITQDGKIYVKDYLSYETQPNHAMVVEVSDGIYKESIIVRISIKNENELIFNAINLFTPNNDGVNDYWEIENPHLFSACAFTIFNNIGETVYKSIGYNNDWNATNKGSDLPIGTYYYFVNCTNCETCNYKGFISIIR